MSSAMFPHPRRIVTGHNEEGKAIVIADGVVPCLPKSETVNFAVLYETKRFPESNDEWVDPIKTPTTDLANDQGIVLRVVDFAPNTKFMFHRTESLDFGILHSGEVTCYLDDGVRVDMKPGDTCVQRGTIHGWINHTDKPARVYFILSAAHPANAGGELLKKVGYTQDEVTSGGELN